MSDFWQAILYVHLLSMAFFVGGMLVLGAVIVPVERDAPDASRMQAMGRRFGYGSLVSLALLVATGTAMASHEDRWDDGTLQLKLVLVAVVVALTLIHLQRPKSHALQGAILVATLVIVWLGLDLAV